MVLINSQIKSEIIFPPDYRIFNVGDNLELIYSGKKEYYTIVNRNDVPHVEKQDSNWLVSPGSSYNAGDINDWLEPTTNELMILGFYMYSDRNIEVTVSLPSSDQRFGIKNQTDAPITPEISPWKEPRVTLYSFGTTYVPSFKFNNPTEYTPIIVKIGVSGFRYELEEIEKPDRYSTVNMEIIKA